MSQPGVEFERKSKRANIQSLVGQLCGYADNERPGSALGQPAPNEKADEGRVEDCGRTPKTEETSCWYVASPAR